MMLVAADGALSVLPLASSRARSALLDAIAAAARVRAHASRSSCFTIAHAHLQPPSRVQDRPMVGLQHCQQSIQGPNDPDAAVGVEGEGLHLHQLVLD